MAKHYIEMWNPNKMVLHADTEFYVYSDDKVLGTLKISKGTIEWRPKNCQYGYHMQWEKFNEIMLKEGYQK